MPRLLKQPAAAEAIPNAPPFDEAASRAAWLEAERRQHADVVYLFVGPGQGVPGLPHRLTLAEAEQMEMTATLKAGLENRNYSRQAAPVSGEAKQES